VRNACTLAFQEMLENCFVNRVYGKEQKDAVSLVYAPLFEELATGDRVSK
jgi:hypothetical protein